MAQNAIPEQRRVYTDPRFENLEIHNFGGPVFVVLEKDPATGRFDEIDKFTAYEKVGVNFVTEPFAQRRAGAYYDRMAKGNMSAEFSDRDAQEEPVPIKSAFNRLKWQPKAHGVDPLAGMREMTPQDVDAVVAQARAETDPQKRQALFKQAMSMAAQQESAAQRVVRMLLSL